AAIEPSLGAVRAAAQLPLAAVTLHAPVPYPGAIYGSGANFRDHLAEMARVMNTAVYDPRAEGHAPWHFLKVPQVAVVGPGANVAIPRHARQLDWEIELAAVIGARCHHVAIGAALDHVAGYTIANDLSARDHVRRPGVAPGTPFAYDWLSQKS